MSDDRQRGRGPFIFLKIQRLIQAGLRGYVNPPVYLHKKLPLKSEVPEKYPEWASKAHVNFLGVSKDFDGTLLRKVRRILRKVQFVAPRLYGVEWKGVFSYFVLIIR